jgi:prephenate dehydrogenase
MCAYFCILHSAWANLKKKNPLATKVGAIVGGQTSVKAPERAAFEKYLPDDVYIVSCHSLHGPTIPPLGQPLVRNLSYLGLERDSESNWQRF